MAITWPEADHGAAQVNVAKMAERLSVEDIALLEAFVVRPTIYLDGIALAARTLLPLSVVEKGAGRLVRAGLLHRSEKGNSIAYRLAWVTEGRRRTRFSLFWR